MSSGLRTQASARSKSSAAQRIHRLISASRSAAWLLASSALLIEHPALRQRELEDSTNETPTARDLLRRRDDDVLGDRQVTQQAHDPDGRRALACPSPGVRHDDQEVNITLGLG